MYGSTKKPPRTLESSKGGLRISTPEGLDVALEGLVRKVLREQPKQEEIYAFAADYFEALVAIRERAEKPHAKYNEICPNHTEVEANELIHLAQSFPKPSFLRSKVTDEPEKEDDVDSKEPDKLESTEELNKEGDDVESKEALEPIVEPENEEDSVDSKETVQEAVEPIEEPNKGEDAADDKKTVSDEPATTEDQGSKSEETTEQVTTEEPEALTESAIEQENDTEEPEKEREAVADPEEESEVVTETKDRSEEVPEPEKNESEIVGEQENEPEELAAVEPTPQTSDNVIEEPLEEKTEEDVGLKEGESNTEQDKEGEDSEVDVKPDSEDNEVVTVVEDKEDEAENTGENDASEKQNSETEIEAEKEEVGNGAPVGEDGIKVPETNEAQIDTSEQHSNVEEEAANDQKNLDTEAQEVAAVESSEDGAASSKDNLPEETTDVINSKTDEANEDGEKGGDVEQEAVEKECIADKNSLDGFIASESGEAMNDLKPDENEKLINAESTPLETEENSRDIIREFIEIEQEYSSKRNSMFTSSIEVAEVYAESSRPESRRDAGSTDEGVGSENGTPATEEDMLTVTITSNEDAVDTVIAMGAESAVESHERKKREISADEGPLSEETIAEMGEAVEKVADESVNEKEDKEESTNEKVVDAKTENNSTEDTNDPDKKGDDLEVNEDSKDKVDTLTDVKEDSSTEVAPSENAELINDQEQESTTEKLTVPEVSEVDEGQEENTDEKNQEESVPASTTVIEEGQKNGNDAVSNEETSQSNTEVDENKPDSEESAVIEKTEEASADDIQDNMQKMSQEENENAQEKDAAVPDTLPEEKADASEALVEATVGGQPEASPEQNLETPTERDDISSDTILDKADVDTTNDTPEKVEESTNDNSEAKDEAVSSHSSHEAESAEKDETEANTDVVTEADQAESNATSDEPSTNDKVKAEVEDGELPTDESSPEGAVDVTNETETKEDDPVNNNDSANTLVPEMNDNASGGMEVTPDSVVTDSVAQLAESTIAETLIKAEDAVQTQLQSDSEVAESGVTSQSSVKENGDSDEKTSSSKDEEVSRSRSSKDTESLDEETPFISAEITTLVQAQDIINDDAEASKEDESDVVVPLKVSIEPIEEEYEGLLAANMTMITSVLVIQRNFRKYLSRKKAKEANDVKDSKVENTSFTEKVPILRDISLMDTQESITMTSSDSSFSSSATKILRKEGKEEILRSNTMMETFTTRSLSENLAEERQILHKTHSLVSSQQGAQDHEVWNALEQELDSAASTIQNSFRAYRSRQRLRREDAVQITASDESLAGSPIRSSFFNSGELHDGVVLEPIELQVINQLLKAQQKNSPDK